MARNVASPEKRKIMQGEDSPGSTTFDSVRGVGCEASARWWALVVLCTGVLMINLDATVVNVALPSIRDDLGFTAASLVWVVNAYMLTFGGFLPLGGRLGDLFGRRTLFLAGIGVFT